MRDSMAKRLILITWIFSFILNIIPIDSIGYIDTNRTGTLSIEHYYNDKPLSDVKFKIFRVADISKLGNLTLTKDYQKYPIDIESIKDYSKWPILSDTLATYIEVDKINADSISITNKNGRTEFANLKCGIYLVMVDKAKQNNHYISTKPFLVSIPSIDPKENTWIYDIKIETKNEESDYEIQYDKINICVEKKWKNNSNTIIPKSITVDLYKNDIIYDSVVLSEDNQWSYMWENLDRTYDWMIIERNVPDNYTVTYEKYGIETIITNTYDDANNIDEEILTDEDKLPQTGVLWWPVPILLIIGIGLITIGNIRYKKDE